MRIGIYFGSTTGNTESVAERIAGAVSDHEVTLSNISGGSVADMLENDLLILGASTWGEGEVQDDWADLLKELGEADLSGKKVAIFGLGDQAGWSDTYVDGMSEIYAAVTAAGAEVVGRWPVDGYDFTSSKAVVDGMFVGLALDESNQPEKTDSRISNWLAGIV